MKLFSFIFIICFLAGCELTTNDCGFGSGNFLSCPTTYRGEGSYQQLQDDRFECLKMSYNRVEQISGNSSGISGSSQMGCSIDMFKMCLASKGWKRVYDGSGVGIATTVSCK